MDMHQIKLSYYQKDPLPNFGDDLSPCLVEHVTGFPVHHVDHDSAELFGAGSILGHWTGRKRAYKKTFLDLLQRQRPLAIWGTGLIRPKALHLPRCEVLALRGPLTQQYAGLRHVPVLGDPGILAKELVPQTTKSRTIGIVPHYVDKNHPVIQSMHTERDFRIIDVERPCKQVCADISSCHLILSSSLHGLVVADSYGIPNARLVLTDQIIGGDFKFKDYALGVERADIPTYHPVSKDDILRAVDDIERSSERAQPEIINTKCAALSAVLKDWMSRRA